MAGIIKPLFFEPARHIYKMLTEPEYLAYNLLASRLRRIPRFTECRAKVHGWDIMIPDAASFLSTYREIFLERIYAFESEDPAPRILDLGANIGLSVLFFKLLYPQSKITAFEADPKIFEYLEKNVHGNGFADVELINKAVWHANTRLRFSSEDAGRIAHKGDGSIVEVDAVNIAGYLKGKRFDFIKMDIEGAEGAVIRSLREYLGRVGFLFVEYHSKADEKQSLDEIIGIMAQAGFRIHIQPVMTSPSPFVKRRINTGFDMQLNIFGWKER